MRASFLASDRTYGARRVWRDLLAEGLSCGLHRIERLMRSQALKARPRRRRLPPDLGERQAGAVAPNVLDRTFEAAAPNRKWIADFTYVWTAEGWLYVAAVIDLFSRRVVGWSMSAAMTAQLVTDALVMAIWRRGKPDALLHHSDRGSQYTSEQFQRLMADNGVVCSMSRSGNVWDNAAMESFFSSLKTERTGNKTYRTRDEAKSGCVRLHRALLQLKTQALDDRVSEPYGVRAEGWIRLTACHPNRVQARVPLQRLRLQRRTRVACNRWRVRVTPRAEDDMRPSSNSSLHFRRRSSGLSKPKALWQQRWLWMARSEWPMHFSTTIEKNLWRSAKSCLHLRGRPRSQIARCRALTATLIRATD